jgi:hypothetical protein
LVLGIQPKASCMLGKCSTYHWAISPAWKFIHVRKSFLSLFYLTRVSAFFFVMIHNLKYFSTSHPMIDTQSYTMIHTQVSLFPHNDSYTSEFIPTLVDYVLLVDRNHV